ncbi:MAG: asparaginase [Hyphomicrobiaceae bacterium]
MSQKSKVAVIGTGGTISSIGRDELDVQNYLSLGRMHDAAGMIATFPTASRFADLIPVAFPPIPSTDMDFPGWAEMLRLIEATEAAHPDVAGFVILHGTATLEETAYALNLTAKTERTIVVTGAQRPSTGLSTDAAANFVDAVRVASDARARGLGVLVVTNNEIHAAREVTKSSTWRLQTFKSPDFGALGHADADDLAIYRKPLRVGAPNGPFGRKDVEAPARVDVSYCYAGCDGAAVRAFVAAGAKGIVSAGFAPGFVSPGEHQALKAAVDSGVVVVQSSRAGSGRVAQIERISGGGFIAADTLNPQKARILLSLALAQGLGPAEIAEVIARY